MAVIELAATNTLGFGQSATSNIKWKAIRHKLNLGSDARSGTIVEQVHDMLLLRQVAVVRHSIVNLAVGHTLGLGQVTIPRAFLEYPEDHLILVQEAQGINTKGASSQLDLIQSATYELVKYNALSEFVLAQSVSFSIVKVEILEQSFVLSHGVSVYKENKNFIVDWD